MANQLFVNHSTKRGYDFDWDPEKRLAEALAERERFLEKYPQYRSFQDEIDRVLDKAGSFENRMAVLALLMEARLIEMHDQFRQLHRILNSVSS